MFRKTKTAAKAACAAMLLIAAPFVAKHEGLRTTAYLDAVSVWTICYGETRDVHKGDTQSVENCNIMLRSRLMIFGLAVYWIVEQDMSPKTHAAFTSFAYNVGIDAFRKSTLVRLYNKGEYKAACDQLPRWNKAKGKILKGLTTRRAEERQLCLSGLQ